MTDGEEYGEYSVDDETQLQPEDSLIGELGEDVLDDGFAVPDGFREADSFGMTVAEQRQGEGLSRRLAQEEPDVGAASGRAGEADRVGGDDLDAITADEDFLGDADEDLTGHLVAPDEGLRADEESDAVAFERRGGHDRSPEEAAMHVVHEGD